MRDRWFALCSSIGPRGDAPALWNVLSALYASPTRPYHNLDHVAACLDRLDAWTSHAAAPRLIELALWLHDCIYDAKSGDNEARSADIAALFGRELGLPVRTTERVRELIMVTRHQPPIGPGDDALIADIDMAILAAEFAAYDEYAAAVRTEYGFASDAQWRKGRGEFLKGLLARPAIFLSPPGRALEGAARANLGRELAMLG